MSEQTNQSWGGRFSQPTDEFVKIFGASVFFDKILAPYDIAGSRAHTIMLQEVGLLTENEKDQILTGLDQILVEIDAGEFEWSVTLEDVHMNIESRLTKLIGNAGKKLHTGRSRNDQVATDIRLYLRDQVDGILAEINRLQLALLDLAEKEANTIMPGFTHLQAAQPVSFGHHMMAYFEMLTRDAERLIDCRKRMNSMPLGSAALAGTTYPINRERTAELLGFDRICLNSLDGVSDRDFAIEFLSTASIIMMHLSRFSEELILWSSAQFHFIELPDSFCTGSSIMPQKKNPDVPELVRGKTGRVYGNLTSMLTIMKSQPLAYNKDNQEDKEPLFDTVDTLKACLRVFADMVPTIETQRDTMYNSTKKGYTTATDLADYLVNKGLAFRDAHEVVGKSVSYGIEHQKDLSELSLEELQAFDDHIENDVFEVLSLEGSLAARDHLGATSPNQVKQAIQTARNKLK
ncbi:Argininosuccinate lyase (EC 4.3.2.1) [uncultured Gammaproteobacteria bacterium]|uniref:argininosuccinate lyase n=1 Tax=Bathymodiolus heckerae thiotrophic gill symbiont TaxID=1052212 RepID=UPI0010B8439F|nr:argininosuccinate lyase [Bathymodiolus heckerae thiotrophic gill symbiont]CAC9548209.1 Argininosuccinate lyase (EC 4.3.2.1) [uncultured Gammaproteobacteria bacterium]CAC9604136.1 Argininosuccinate lyase (EC 4.3.2.1) [uncultured Gammaproteobacteria bacterium]SHN89108.1 Argininosuccinate lyase [Bathymodiolus heckerae thiotrophic gill symbiont]